MSDEQLKKMMERGRKANEASAASRPPSVPLAVRREEVVESKEERLEREEKARTEHEEHRARMRIEHDKSCLGGLNCSERH